MMRILVGRIGALSLFEPADEWSPAWFPGVLEPFALKEKGPGPVGAADVVGPREFPVEALRNPPALEEKRENLEEDSKDS